MQIILAYFTSLANDMQSVGVNFSQWWQTNNWQTDVEVQIIWIVASFVLSFGILRLIFGRLIRESLQRLTSWLLPDREGRSSQLFVHLIEQRFLIINQLLLLVAANFLQGLGLATSWIVFAQTQLSSLLVILIFRNFFHTRGIAIFLASLVIIYGLIHGLGLEDTLLPWLYWQFYQFGETSISVAGLTRSIVLFLLFIWVAVLLINVINAALRQQLGVSPSIRLLTTKFAKFFLFFLALTLAMESLGISLQSLSFFAGAVGIGVGLGLQRLIANLASGMVLLLDKSIKPGDFIEIDGRQGIIRKMTSRAITITDAKQIDYIIPNENLMEQTIINWSHDSDDVWISLSIGVAYHTDLDLAMRLMAEAARENPRVAQEHDTPCFIKDFADSSIALLVAFVIKDPGKGIFGLQSDIRYRIWRKFREHNIEIPFPQREVRVKHDVDTSLTSTTPVATRAGSRMTRKGKKRLPRKTSYGEDIDITDG